MVDKYKYLGIILETHFDFNITASVLASAVERALGTVISIFRGFKMQDSTHFVKCITLMQFQLRFIVREYGDNSQNRATRYYLGVHQKSLIFAIQ